MVNNQHCASKTKAKKKNNLDMLPKKLNKAEGGNKLKEKSKEIT